jgi:arylsulfatase A-like enzyme
MFVNRRQAMAAMAAPLFSQPAERPNVLYILADDLGIGDLGCYQSDAKTQTPNLDRFAKQGVRFTDAHSPSAVCTPTRYGILTGRYCWRTPLKSGVLWGYSPSLIEPGRLTVASMLRDAGYETGVIGKWHLGLGTAERADYTKPLKPSPLDFGFDSFFGIPGSLDMEPYVWIENDRAVAPPTGTIAGRQEQRGIYWREGPIAPGFQHDQVLPMLTKRAESWIGKRSAAKPWFLYLPLTSPHAPWLPTRPFGGRSSIGPYGDFVAQTDDSIGRVLKALDASGQARNTLVIITSDNGAHWTPAEIARSGHRANGPWRGQKADIHEAGHRVPMLLRWPSRMRANTTSSQLVCHTDLMATLAGVLRIPLPNDAAEDSFPFLTPDQPGLRSAIVHHSSRGHFAIRQGSWKLHLGRGSGGFTDPAEIPPKPGEPAGELFNLADDPGETRNRYSDEPMLVEQLTRLLDDYRTSGRSRPIETR